MTVFGERESFLLWKRPLDLTRLLYLYKSDPTEIDFTKVVALRGQNVSGSDKINEEETIRNRTSNLEIDENCVTVV